MESDDLKFFNPWGEIITTKNRLPHWQQTGACYFITWRLADSIPKEKLDSYYHDKKIWLLKNPEPWSPEIEAEYHSLFSTKLDQWMDNGFGSCILARPNIASTVKDTLLFYEGTRTTALSFVIMPNHVHYAFSLNSEYRLEKIIQSWKGYSAQQINSIRATSGTNLWQKDYFDRIIRNRKHFENCVRYIRRNPEKANLRKHEYILWESELAKSIE